VELCPSGALQYRRLDGGAEEAVGETTTVTPIRNGPLLVRGRIEVTREDGTVETLPRATLCRCGESEHKPFCDNRHLKVGFRAPGVVYKIHLSPVRPVEDQPISKAVDPRAH
jgi:CDGSH-type Zn-finger protein